MARCKLTNMNLRTIRKSKEYQALLIDLVAVGIVGQSAAEGILGYTIPAGLLGSTVTDDGTEPSGEGESGGESGGEGSRSVDVDVTVTPKVTLLYYDTTGGIASWETAEYDLTNDPTGAGILSFARAEFNDDSLNITFVSEENPEYIEGESTISSKYIRVDPQPDTIESGQLIEVYFESPDNMLEG